MICVLFLVISLNLASAKLIDYKEHIVLTKYDNDDRVVMTKTIYADYDNDDRYSTYDYRRGYSYRTSQNYWDRKHKDTIYLSGDWDDDYSYKQKKSGCNPYGKWEDHDRYLDRSYGRYSRKTKTKKCYSSPPSGKLFYSKC